MFCVPFEHISKSDVARAGGKGASLGEMTQAGIPVPPGVVILAPTFDQFLQTNQLTEQIAAILSQVKHTNQHALDTASQQIQTLMLSAPMPPDMAEEIMAAHKKLNAEFVAVRSSATAEDSSAASWAGELETYLNTPQHQVLDKVKQCWSSLFTPRAIFYRFEQNLHHSSVSVAVVIQAMIQSEVAGICFTVHPVTKDPDQLIIEGGYGLGEAIVGGMVTPDTYVLSKTTNTFLEKNISEQAMMIVRSGEGNIEMEVPDERRSIQKIPDEVVLELSQLCQKIERHYGKPQDIEWAWYQGKIYILQSRPITTL